MNNVKEEVLAFLDKCNKLKTSKFIVATDGVREILKSIVNSPALYELFQAVTKNFDYVAAKRQCFVTETQGYTQKSYIKLPVKASERLSFIFCLLVEFDHETLNFTDFIQQYFPEDKSCYASFNSFCDKIICPLEDIIKDVFSEELDGSPVNVVAEEKKNEVKSPASHKLTVISILIAHEKEVVKLSQMPAGDKEDGLCILTEIDEAMREGRTKSMQAALCGYDYFSRCHGNFSELLHLLTAELE